MTTIKVNQKVRLSLFTSAKKQMKETALEVQSENGSVVGKINDMFHLGQKIEMILSDGVATKGYLFGLEVNNNQFVVVRRKD